MTVPDRDITSAADWLKCLLILLVLLIMAWRRTTHPLLPTYLDRRPFNRPEVSIACPDGLTLALAQQSLIPVLDTRADGNCGIHAFILSLVDKVALHQSGNRFASVTCPPIY